MKKILSLLLMGCFAILNFTGTCEARLSNNDRRAVVLEAFYALRQSADGGCDRTLNGNCISTWNYLNNDYGAYLVLKGWYSCNSSDWAVPGDPPQSDWADYPKFLLQRGIIWLQFHWNALSSIRSRWPMHVLHKSNSLPVGFASDFLPQLGDNVEQH
jgi:hypothetical protein